MDAFLGLPHLAEFVFYNPETMTNMKDIKTAFKAACRRAKKDPDDEKDPGIVGLRLHDLRHTAASKMIEAGVDLVTVSKILGHASIQMTMRYAHPTPENMRRAIEHLAESFGSDTSKSRQGGNSEACKSFNHLQLNKKPFGVQIPRLGV